MIFSLKDALKMMGIEISDRIITMQESIAVAKRITEDISYDEFVAVIEKYEQAYQKIENKLEWRYSYYVE